ncbi:alpha-mannosidase 2-like [Nymphaea colorata]|nr:alpha-mannosidase 2-like [Nymphaea colorata]
MAGRRGAQTLPYSKVKTKTSRRRKSQLRDFLSTNIFCIGIIVSLGVFIVVVLRYGIPIPPSTRPQNSSYPPFSRRKSSPLQRFTSLNGTYSPVDISTKGLYDKIQFLDVDGGPWKQGWVVKYKGDEWNDEKLKVFVVPHSHNDPGWKLTVEEYYMRQSRHILDTIVETLSKDTRRKFIWEEMSYLERWWRDASESKKQSLINLVKNGQLEIVGGGWVMNDEANSHYFAIIEQMMEGNMWLADNVGVVPKNAWAIDPFGYSATMAYLLRRMGFENMLIQRTHYEVKKELALHQNLEFLWRQVWDLEGTADIFVHMMPFYSYDVPHTCGPEPAVCCQFDFARTHGFSYEFCPWGEHPVETNPSNVQERALKLLDQYRKKSTLYRTNTLLIPLGDDFRYVTVDEAEAQFRNYQLLFDYINSNPSLNAEAMFGTLEDYFQTLRAEAERINFSRAGELGSEELEGFPSLSGDFFTYADRQQDYWSGYYVSRPFFKAVDRVLEETLRASEIMFALVMAYCQRHSCAKFPINFSDKLTAARRNLALFQHHDGVTGTAKDHVVEDYGLRMHTSLDDLKIFMSKSVEVLLNIHNNKSAPSLVSQFEAEEVRSKYNVQPVHRVIEVSEGSAQSIVLFNPLEQSREEIVMVIVTDPDICVLSSNWSSVRSQIAPELQHEKDKLFTEKHRVFWRASVPPLGLQTYYIANGYAGCEKPRHSKLKIFAGLEPVSCPASYTCSKLVEDTVEVQNHLHTLTFDTKHGLLQKVTNHKDHSVTIVEEEIGMYSSMGSGAYLFKPTGEAQPIIQAGGRLVISEGPLMQEVYSYPKVSWEDTPISYSTRIYNGENTVQGFFIEKEYHVDLLDSNFNDRELIARFKTEIENKQIFYSDLNGFQMSRRETYDKIPLQGNYYPMPSLAFLQNSEGHRFSIHSRQSLGVASLRNGWLEIMLDRRLTQDDGRGLGQGVLDNRPMNVIFHLLIEKKVSVSVNDLAGPAPLNPSLLSHRVSGHLNYPMHIFVSKKAEEKSGHSPPKSFSPLISSLPCDVHIVGFKVPRPLKFLDRTTKDLRFLLILQKRGWDSSYCNKGGFGCSTLTNGVFDLFSMFNDLSIQEAKAASLNTLHDYIENVGSIDERHRKKLQEITSDGEILLYPMELQAYKLEILLKQ